MALIDKDQHKKFKEALADIIVSSQGLCTYDACKDVAEREATFLISMLLPEPNIQSSNIKETIRAEIERRIRNETTNASYLELGRIQGNNTLAEHLLSFLDNLEAEENNAFCKEGCKGYQDTGKCFCDGGCEAKKKSKEKEVDLEEHYKQWLEEYMEQSEGYYPTAQAIALHFYELGFNARKKCSLNIKAGR